MVKSSVVVAWLVFAVALGCAPSSRHGGQASFATAAPEEDSVPDDTTAPGATAPVASSAPASAPPASAPPASAPPATTHPVSSRGFLQLPREGPGFIVGSVPERRWGTSDLVLGLERVARRWANERPQLAAPRIRIGDLGFENGGPISGHASHQLGVDVDIALPRGDGKDLPRIDRFTTGYSRAAVQKLVDLCRAEMKVTHVFFNDPQVKGVSPWPNHDNHLHVRIKRP